MNGSKMSRTTMKVGMLVLGFTLVVSGVLVGGDAELDLRVRLVVAAILMLGGIASMVRALVFETDAPVRHRAAGAGSRR